MHGTTIKKSYNSLVCQLVHLCVLLLVSISVLEQLSVLGTVSIGIHVSNRMLRLVDSSLLTDVPRALRSFETPVCTYLSKKHDVLEHLNIQQHLCKILVSRDSALSEFHLVQVRAMFI